MAPLFLELTAAAIRTILFGAEGAVVWNPPATVDEAYNKSPAVYALVFIPSSSPKLTT